MNTEPAERPLLIFDLDGTLFRADSVTVPAVQRAFEESDLAPPTVDEILPFIGRPPAQFREWMRTVCDTSVATEVTDHADALEIQMIGETGSLFDGVLEMLVVLRETANAMAICTNGTAPYVDPVVDIHGLRPFFDEVRHLCYPADTKPSMVAELMARFPSRQTIVIGDRHHDVEAARDNGAMSVGVLYGYGSKDELSGADAFVDAPSQISSVVEKLLRRSGS